RLRLFDVSVTFGAPDVRVLVTSIWWISRALSEWLTMWTAAEVSFTLNSGVEPPLVILSGAWKLTWAPWVVAMSVTTALFPVILSPLVLPAPPTPSVTVTPTSVLIVPSSSITRVGLWALTITRLAAQLMVRSWLIPADGWVMIPSVLAVGLVLTS